MIRDWLARTPARLIEKVKMTHFFSQKVCPDGQNPWFWDGAGPGNHGKWWNDTLFFTKSVSILMEIKENDQNTYSNSYKKLMILRESNPIEQNRCENDRNSWNPMKMINPTHFSSQKVCRISEIWRFSTPREVKWTELKWTDLNWTELNSTELNWTEPNWTEPTWTEPNWTQPN